MQKYFDQTTYSHLFNLQPKEEQVEEVSDLNSSFMAESMFELLGGEEPDKSDESLKFNNHQQNDINQSNFWESMKDGRIDSVISQRSLPQFNNLFDESSIHNESMAMMSEFKTPRNNVEESHVPMDQIIEFNPSGE